jgi:hypothetical protein
VRLISLPSIALLNRIDSINLTLLSIFTIEVFVSIFSFGPLTYCRSWVSLLDATVVLTTIVLDIYFHFSTDPSSKSPYVLFITSDSKLANSDLQDRAGHPASLEGLPCRPRYRSRT